MFYHSSGHTFKCGNERNSFSLNFQIRKFCELHLIHEFQLIIQAVPQIKEYFSNALDVYGIDVFLIEREIWKNNIK